MTHVSKHKIKEKDFGKLYEQLQTIIARQSKKNIGFFFDELFSESEKIMFTKRLSALVMFKKGCSEYRVAHTLYISPSTASRIKLKFDTGAYDNMLKLLNKEFENNFWKILEVVLRGGLPPMGKHRWKGLTI